MELPDIQNIDFGSPKDPAIIKVIGVGGGGGSAVNHMYAQGIEDVSFVVVNTDKKALSISPVPIHLQLGEEGLGAGNKPEKGRQIAEESVEDIRNMLDDGTKMAFITAGMGGGTGTGAAPVVARCAKEKGILTVGIVTIPFAWEGNSKIDQALDGVDAMAKNVDALIVINNERLRQIYTELGLFNGFEKANDTLCVAAKSIAEIITTSGYVGLDFQDVKTILKDGGVALISTGYGEGEGRVSHAINEALDSPLLHNNSVYDSKKVLLSITTPPKDDPYEMRMEEMAEIHEFMSKFENSKLETKWGITTDDTLGKKIKVTILAAGFGVDDIDEMKAHHDKMTEEERRLNEELEAEKALRREKIYGPTNGSARIRKTNYYFLFAEDELDDENIISTVEASATHNRTREQLNSIRKVSQTRQPATETEMETSGHIEF